MSYQEFSLSGRTNMFYLQYRPYLIHRRHLPWSQSLIKVQNSAILHVIDICVHKNLAHNLNEIKNQILSLDKNDYKGRSQRLIMLKPPPPPPPKKKKKDLRDIWPSNFTFLIANVKGAEKTAQMRWLSWAFVVHKQQSQAFFHWGSYDVEAHGSWPAPKAFVRVCLYVPCGQLLGKGFPLGSLLWSPTVSLSLCHWYPRPVVVHYRPRICPANSRFMCVSNALYVRWV